jgi:SPP1 gp7 family putative phage head morphogenesis protein
MRDLILRTLKESVKAYPDITDYLTGETLMIYWLSEVKVGEAPDDEVRVKDERRIERNFRAFLEGQKKRVLTYIRTHDMKAIQPSFWDDEISKLWRELGKDFVGILVHGVDGGLNLLPGGGTGEGADMDKINMTILNYMRNYRNKWLSKIEETSRRYIEQKINDWMLSGDPLSTLIKSIEEDSGGMFSKARARRIAVTEVTRLHAMGNKLAWEEAGTVSQWRWNTANDELVCPICRPNNGKLFPLSELDNRLPAHVNCRCWSSPVVDEEMFGDEIDRILGGGG